MRRSLCLVLGLALACSKPAAKEDPRFGPSDGPGGSVSELGAQSRLTGTLNSGHIDLRWEAPSSAVAKGEARPSAPAGYFVEFRTNLDETFTLLDAVWADTHSFRHPDVVPETTFIYRIRPFFGGASPFVEITTGSELPDADASHEEEGPVRDGERPGGGDKKSLRIMPSAADGIAAEVTVTPSSPTSVVVRWKDRADDEDGYLVEMAAANAPAFQICALLPPDATSFRKTQLPAQTRFSFRVRAYFSGTPSNLATVTSGRP